MYRNFSRIMSHKMKFSDLYRIHTLTPKWWTKTMPIGLLKITQNRPKRLQYPDNLSQKYNPDQTHVSRSILTSKCLQYRRKPNWYKILNRKHQAIIRNTTDNSQNCTVEPKENSTSACTWNGLKLFFLAFLETYKLPSLGLLLHRFDSLWRTTSN